MLGFPMLYFKGRRILMFQLSGFYCSSRRASGNLQFCSSSPSFSAIMPETGLRQRAIRRGAKPQHIQLSACRTLATDKFQASAYAPYRPGDAK